MNTTKKTPRVLIIMLWMARIWSLFIFAMALLILFTPDPNATNAAVPAEDWFLLSLWGAAILGLLIAWRWKLAGGIIAISLMFVREIAWVILKGDWLISFLIIWAIILPPAILFLIVGNLERKTQKINADVIG